MTLGAPLLSISRNAAEWLADLNDSVTLLLSPMANVFNGDTENYIIKNTHVCCAEYAKSTIISETVYVIPSGNCEVEMMLLPERQMKNIWTGVFVPMEHRQTTMDLSAISTEALSQYQTVFFWHTECYLMVSKLHV